MKFLHKILILAFWATISISPVEAQLLPFHQYTTHEGLISNTITNIYQDKKGYLWIGTANGINIYDGKTFTTLTSSDGLAHDYVTGILEDRFIEGKMWIGTWGGGVSSYFKGTFTNYITTSRSRIRKIFQDKEGTVWCADEDIQATIKPNETNPIHIYEQIPEPADIVSLNDSILYFAYANGIATYNLLTHKLDNISHIEIQGKRFWLLCLSRNGTLYACRDDNSLLSIHDDNIYSVMNGFRRGENLFESPSGEIWSVSDEGWAKYNLGFSPPLLTYYTTKNGLPQRGIKCSFIDREGTIWLGTWNDGLLKLSQLNEFSIPFNLTSGIGQNYSVVAVDSNEHLWLLTKEGLKENWKDSTEGFHSYMHVLPENFKPGNLASLTFDKNWFLWLVIDYAVIASYHVIFHQYKEATLQKDATNDFRVSSPGVGVISLYSDSRNNLWYGKGGEGLYMLDSARKNNIVRFHNDSMKSTLPPDYTRMFFEDRKGKIWAGFFKIGLVRIDSPDGNNSSYHVFTTKNGLSEDRIRQIGEDDRGRIWVGTDTRGITIIDNDSIRTLTMKNGLPSNSISFIYEDPHRRMWIGTGNGLVYLDNPDSKIFKRKHDLLSDKMIINGGTFKNGTMWFLSTEGITYYNIEQDTVLTVPPPVLLTHLSVNGIEQQPFGSYTFSPEQNNVVIEYIGLSYRDEKAVRYRYRLLGADLHWRPGTAGTSVSYSALQPGTYVFEVKAINLDGIESIAPAGVSFIILPPFWQRWWFYSLIILSSLGVLYILVRRRVVKFQAESKQQQEFSRKLMESQEMERKRIAAELHDGLGQNLLLIYNQLVLGKKIINGQPEIEDQLEEISRTTSQAIEEVREITFNLRPFILDRLGLTQALTSLVERSGKSTTIKFSHEIDPINGLFTKEAEMNMYRIVQEGLNNVLKHSEATEASVIVLKNETYVTVSIEDNGKGFNTESRENANNSGGFGLQGIAERVRIIKGAYTVTSSPENGTTIVITIPISENYHE